MDLFGFPIKRIYFLYLKILEKKKKKKSAEVHRGEQFHGLLKSRNLILTDLLMMWSVSVAIHTLL